VQFDLTNLTITLTLQVYYSRFRLEIFTCQVPEHILPSLSAKLDKGTKQAIAIAILMTMIFVADVVEFVQGEVQKQIKLDHRAETSEDRNHIMAIRRKSLKVWAESAYPLTTDDVGTVSALVRAMSQKEPEEGEVALPKASQEMSHHTLATEFYKIATRATIRVTAPMIWNSPFVRSLPEAFRLMKNTMKNADDDEIAHRWKGVFGMAFVHLKVAQVPCKGPGGSPKPRYDLWQDLHLPSSVPGADLGNGTMKNGFVTAAQSIIDRSAINADWDSSTITLRDLHKFVSRVRPPSDLMIDRASLPGAKKEVNGYLHDTYTYIISKIDMSDPIHRLVIFISIVMSKLVPYLAHSSQVPADVVGSYNGNNITKAVRRSPWTDSKHKGSKNSGPYLTMFTVHCLALLDSESPLRKYMSTHKGGLGSPWTSKHGKESDFLW